MLSLYILSWALLSISSKAEQNQQTNRFTFDTMHSSSRSLCNDLLCRYSARGLLLLLSICQFVHMYIWAYKHFYDHFFICIFCQFVKTQRNLLFNYICLVVFVFVLFSFFSFFGWNQHEQEVLLMLMLFSVVFLM